MLLLFKYAVSFLVWFLLLGGIGVLAIAAGICWKGYLNYEDDPRTRNKAEIEFKAPYGTLPQTFRQLV